MKKQMKLMAGVLGLTGVLASCGTSPSDNLGETPVITGRMSNYTQGEGIVQVSTGSSANSSFQTGALKADGSFGVVLPTPITSDLMAVTVPKCLIGSVNNSTPDVKAVFAVNTIFDRSNNIKIGSMVRSTIISTQPVVVGAKSKLAIHIYVDKEFTLTYLDCSVNQNQNSTIIYDGSTTLKAGWNVVYQEFEVLEVSTTSPALATKTKISVGMGASGLDWRFETGTVAPFKAPFSLR